MGRTTSLFSTVAAALLPSAPAADAYLTIPGVPGDSTRKGHEDDIEVLDWTFGLAAPAGHGHAGGGAGAGKVTAQDLVVVLPTGTASPPLVEAVATGRHLATVTLEVERRQPTGTSVAYLTVKLDDVLVAGYDAAAHPVTAVPADVVRFRYGALTVTVRPQDPRGGARQPVEAHVNVTGRGR